MRDIRDLPAKKSREEMEEAEENLYENPTDENAEIYNEKEQAHNSNDTWHQQEDD